MGRNSPEELKGEQKMIKEIRELVMFCGYGTETFAFKRLGIEPKIVGYSDIDKYANKCFQQNHGGKELGDCKNINPHNLEEMDIITAGFPCQDVSVAGKNDLSKGRTILVNHVFRVAEIKQPKYMLLENVRGILSKRHKEFFNYVLKELDRIGYYVTWKILNTKELGIPQNRERVFFVCYRKDLLKEYDNFEFPEKEELKIFLKDILEDEVDDKYYLSEKQMNQLIFNVNSKGIWNTNPSGNGMNGVVNLKDIANTISTNKGEGQKIIQVGELIKEGERRINECPVEINQYLRNNKGNLTIKEICEKSNILFSQGSHYFRIDKSRAIPKPEVWFKLKKVLNFDNTYDKIVTELERFSVEYESSRRVYSEEGCSPTISSANAAKFILIKNATKKGYLEGYPGDGVNLDFPKSNTRRGRIIKNCSGTLQCNEGRGVVTKDFWIRKLTPKECFRLQGFLNDEINLEGLSNAQRYKLAGNGQSVNVVEKIFYNMFVKNAKGVQDE